MFSYIHLADTTRLMGLGYPLPYIFFAIAFAYFFTLAPAPCLRASAGDLLTSNKSLATSSDPRFDPRMLLGILAGTFVLAQSTLVDRLYVSLGLLHSALAHRPL